MPISTETRRRYPTNWNEISDWVRFVRAGGRCECSGECGRPDGHLGPDVRCRNRHGQPRWGGARRQCTVILSTAHLNHVPEDDDPDEMLALCEGCHLAYDRQHHAATRRARQAEALGMDPLF